MSASKQWVRGRVSGDGSRGLPTCILCRMIEYQRLILGDAVRNTALVEALEDSIVPGETTVADIGSGTGFLAFLASKMGAKECYLYESTELINLSKKIAQENGITNCHFIRRHSMEVKNPPKADLVISETLGNYALEENILEILHDAKRFLKPGGRMIPHSIRQFVCPVASPRLQEGIDIWNDIPLDLHYKAAREISLQNIYVRRIEKADLLASVDAIRQWDRIELGEDDQSIREAIIEWPCAQKTHIEGFAIWWECDLAPGIMLSTSPLSPATHWEQIYLPLLHPLNVEKGQTARLSLRSDSRMEIKISIRWTAEIINDSGKTIDRQELDMQKGFVD